MFQKYKYLTNIIIRIDIPHYKCLSNMYVPPGQTRNELLTSALEYGDQFRGVRVYSNCVVASSHCHFGAVRVPHQAANVARGVEWILRQTRNQQVATFLQSHSYNILKLFNVIWYLKPVKYSSTE